ncbi:hypothetical protein FB451DRAFT_1385631 [Mycena latifolia]|nr:hypothetical protein FB451DRAFT_1385631 [Mycena latifolia]
MSNPQKNFQPQKTTVFPAVAYQKGGQQVAQKGRQQVVAVSGRKSVNVPIVAATNQGQPTTYVFPGTKSKDLNPKQPFGKATMTLPNGGVDAMRSAEGFAPSPKK